MGYMIATVYEGFKRVWPEMPDEVAEAANEKLAERDLEAALVIVRDWEMGIRWDLTRRWAQACDERDALMSR